MLRLPVLRLPARPDDHGAGGGIRAASRPTDGRRLFRAGAVILSLLAVVFAASGCGAKAEAEKVDFEAPVSVEQALGLEGKTLAVEGFLLSEEGETRLCSAVLESYPPQCGGDFLTVEGAEAEDFVGLTGSPTSVGREVKWSELPRTVVGVKNGNTLKVETKPVVAEAIADHVRVRFSYGPEPLGQKGKVVWYFDITNLGLEPLTIMFADGQRGEVVLSRDGAEVYRFSAGKAFTEAIEEVTIQGGGQWGFLLEDELSIPPAEYEVAVRVTTRLPSLPELALRVLVD